MTELQEEIDFLWTFWLTHSCDKCGDDPKRRFPTKKFPKLFQLLQVIK